MTEIAKVEVLSGYILVSEELLMDCGVIPDTREYKPISRWRKLRWRVIDLREAAAKKVYRLVAGYSLPEYDY